ncbi:MAG: heparan-alpha-glucosaminide N-acetyltransferase domain-containing protein [Bacteroidota bacterium]|nr:heparan-alpha-glucosaminide N-acetyltransferase domain-containing protein [Bacteroidota bacterium]
MKQFENKIYNNKSNRIISVDIFRGLTMAMMILVNYPGSESYVYAPLEHSEWNGITPTDLIFPFFIFIVGVSIALSYTRQIEASKPRKEMVKKILVRTIKIYVIGLFLHYLPDLDFTRIDLFGVLQRIAIVFMVCALLFIYTNWKTQISITVGILIVYWITMSFIPTGAFGTGVLEPGVNFAAWFDRLFFSVKMIGKHGWNSEGLYSTFPAVATGLTGMLAGRLILSKKIIESTIIWLFIAGVACIVAGSIWGWQFPINKKIWTSSYVLYTSGWASVTLAVFLWFIDFLRYKNSLVARAGVIFGSNAIVIYVMADIFQTIYKYSHFHDFVYNGLSNHGMSEVNASLIWALISVSSCFLVAYILYRKKLFFKI